MDQHPYLPQTPAQIEEMLRVIGANSVDDLFADVPPALRLASPPDLGEALTEGDLMADMAELIAMGGSGDIYADFPIGAGFMNHERPALVDRLAKLPEFYSAYTPYQAEASQGLLQAFHEFQTMIARLLGCEIANASLYDGATALAEAAFMAREVTRGRGRFLVSDTVAPQFRAVLKTYLDSADLEMITIGHGNGQTDWERIGSQLDESVAAVIAANPNFFGALEDLRPAAAMAHRVGALLIATTEPLLMGILEPPGSMGADIVVADGCSLGLTPFAGGDALGLFACREEYLRKVPGRLVGLTKDTEGRTAYTLTLQTREQHIRREKATSNICTNQGLHALRVAVFLACAGPKGLKEIGAGILGAAAEARGIIEGATEKWDVVFKAPTADRFVIRPTDAQLCFDWTKMGLPLDDWYPDLEDCYLVSANAQTVTEDILLWARELNSADTLPKTKVKR